MNTEIAAQVAQAAASVIVGFVGLWFTWRTVRLDREKKRLELEESTARMQCALNLTLTTNVREQGAYLFIETMVDIHNPSHRTWSIPAVYISYRALVDTQEPQEFKGKEGFADLPECDGLRVTRNRAHLQNSIWSADPDERVRLVRIDRVATAFRERYLTLWVNVEAFGSSYELLGEIETEANGFGKLRSDWIDFSNQLEAADASFVAIGRLNKTDLEDWPGFKSRDRCVFKASGKGCEADAYHSRQFRDVLLSTRQWTMDSIVELGRPAQRFSSHRRIANCPGGGVVMENSLRT